MEADRFATILKSLKITIEDGQLIFNQSPDRYIDFFLP